MKREQLAVRVDRKDLIRFHSLRLRDGLRPREMVEAALDAYEREKGAVSPGCERAG